MFPRVPSQSILFRRSLLSLFAVSLVGAGFAVAQSRGERLQPSGPPPQPQRPIERFVDRPRDREFERPMPRRMERPMERPVERQRDPREQPKDSVRSTRGDEAAPFPRPAQPQLVAPRPMPRCTVHPTPEYWKTRDLGAEIQQMARRGNIQVHPVKGDLKTFDGWSQYPAGWIAYGFTVPPGDTLKVSLEHPNRGWFRLQTMNKWGQLEQGMLQNVLHTFEPVVTYTNPTKEARAVYVLVDDPGQMSSSGNPFTINITRSWDPEQKKIDNAIVVTGIWAMK